LQDAELRGYVLQTDPLEAREEASRVLCALLEGPEDEGLPSSRGFEEGVSL